MTGESDRGAPGKPPSWKLKLPGWITGRQRQVRRTLRAGLTSESERMTWLVFILVWSLSLGILLAGEHNTWLFRGALAFQLVALAISVHKLFVYRGELRFLREFHHLSQTLDDLRQLDLEHPFDRVLEAVVRIVGFDRAVLFRPDPGGKVLRSVSTFGFGVEQRDVLLLPREEGPSIAWRVFLSGVATLVNDPTRHPEVNQRLLKELGSGALALAPISRGGLSLGLLVCDRAADETPINDDDLLQLQVLADQIAITLQNHALHLELARKADQLAQQHARVQQELGLAKLVQDGVLPRTTPAWIGLSTSAFVRSARVIGGDFYRYLDACANPKGRCGVLACRECEHHLQGILIGDVSGKGIPAALVMSVVNSFFQEKVNRLSDPAALLSEVNTSLKLYLGAESRFFSSAFIGFHSPRDNTFVFANGGHDFPLLLRGSAGTPGGGEIEELPSTGTLIGIFRESQFETKTIQLRPGDRILFYTDGLVDWFEQRRGAEDGMVSLIEFLRAGGNETPVEFVGRVQTLLESSPDEPEDDVTALLMVVG